MYPVAASLTITISETKHRGKKNPEKNKLLLDFINYGPVKFSQRLLCFYAPFCELHEPDNELFQNTMKKAKKNHPIKSLLFFLYMCANQGGSTQPDCWTSHSLLSINKDGTWDPFFDSSEVH